MIRMPGGNNNQVFRLETAAGEVLVLKRYFSDRRDPRDRLAAEWSFLAHAWARNIRTIPEPLACDPAQHAGLYGFVEGRRLGVVEQAHVDAAADFVVAVNATPRDPSALSPASESCFSLAEHIESVARRVDRLERLDADTPDTPHAMHLVEGALVPKWRAVKTQIEDAAKTVGLALQQPIAPSACCLSPSDFGFHNALAGPHRLFFLDFEYAGRDDPAKLVCDFFCQPEVPVPMHYHTGFVARLAQGLELDQAFVTRCRILLDAYRVKWACIMLNDFLPSGAARRAFAGHGDHGARCARQLAKAEALLSDIAT